MCWDRKYEPTQRIFEDTRDFKVKIDTLNAPSADERALSVAMIRESNR